MARPPRAGPGALAGEERRRALGLSVGLIGVQVVWGLQSIGTTRIFQTLGASVADLPILWIAGPIAGLLVQPVVGYWSDRAAVGEPRRLPYLAAGAITAAVAMIAMVQATTLWIAVAGLWLLMAAANVSMQPLRALLADHLPPEKRAAGYALQAVFIGTGAVFAAALPWMLANWFGLAGTAPAGALPPTVRTAFRIGAVVLLATTAWTIIVARRLPAIRTRSEPGSTRPARHRTDVDRSAMAGGAAWVAAGLAVAIGAQAVGLRREIFLVAAIMAAYGALTLTLAAKRKRGADVGGVFEIVADMRAMPRVMRRLAVTQFFTWFSLFAFWIYAVPAIAARFYGVADAASPQYARAADHVGLLFAVSDAGSVAGAFALPALVRRIGLRASYAAGLGVGTVGVAALSFLRDPALLWLPAIAMGMGRASILSAPYAIVANAVPPARLGEYLGIHNIFLVIPQLVAACVLGAVLQNLLGGDPAAMLTLAAASLAVAAASVVLIPAADDPA